MLPGDAGGVNGRKWRVMEEERGNTEVRMREIRGKQSELCRKITHTK